MSLKKDMAGLILLLFGLLLSAQGRDSPGRALKQASKSRRYSNAVVVKYNHRQPVVYPRESWECVEYTINAARANTDDSTPILAFMQTEEQNKAVAEGSLDVEYIDGSNCTEDCREQVRLPNAGENGQNFYIMLVNARHSDPPFEPQLEEDVEVTLTAQECNKILSASSPREGKKSKKSSWIIFPILFPLLGLIILILVCFVFAYKHRKRYPKEEEHTSDSDRMAPLAGAGNRQGLDEAPPLAQTVEPPLSYIPPQHESPHASRREKPSSQGQNPLWGRWSSKKLSGRFQSNGPPAGESSVVQRSQPAEESGAAIDLDFDSDMEDNQVFGAAEESQTDAEGATMKVFVNNMFHRMRSGMRDSFKTFTSFADRGDRPSGVKLKSLTSIVKKQNKVPNATVKEEDSPKEAPEPEAPSGGDPQHVTALDIPGAEYASDSPEEGNTTPFADPGFQRSSAKRIMET